MCLCSRAYLEGQHPSNLREATSFAKVLRSMVGFWFLSLEVGVSLSQHPASVSPAL